MKKFLIIVCVIGCFTGCASKPVTTTKERRGDPAVGNAYANFVTQRTQELEKMGGPFKDPAVARQKALSEADGRFGGPGGDSVTTTWTTGKQAARVQAQEEFTDKLDEMAKEKKGL